MTAQNPDLVPIVLIEGVTDLVNRCGHDLLSQIFRLVDVDGSAVKADHSRQTVCCEQPCSWFSIGAAAVICVFIRMSQHEHGIVNGGEKLIHYRCGKRN